MMAPAQETTQAVVPQALDTPEALGFRAAAAGHRDSVAGMFFNSAMDVLTAKVGPAGAEKAFRLALGAGRKQFEAFYRYPVADLLKLMDAGARIVGGDYASLVADFGRAATQSFLKSPMGRTLLVLSGREPHRLLFSLSSGNNAPATPTSREYTRTGPCSAIIRYTSELLGPAWVSGSIEQALSSVFGLQAQISVSNGELPGSFELTVRW
jgi:uncharacterized protein (TIGR02265 family)